MPSITEAKVLILATNGFEQSELTVPRDKLREAGATVHVASLDGKDITGWDKTDWGDTVPADLGLGDTSVRDYDALVLPGGQINPDILRTEPEAVMRVREFLEAGKPTAAICHAPWLLVEADLLRGKRATSYPSIRTDLRNAGADVVDEEVVTDGVITTSRNPGDLEAFVKRIIDQIEGRHDQSVAA